MAYQLQCDGCELDRTITDWATANSRASEHEADYPDHWVTIYEIRNA